MLLGVCAYLHCSMHIPHLHAFIFSLLDERAQRVKPLSVHVNTVYVGRFSTCNAQGQRSSHLSCQQFLKLLLMTAAMGVSSWTKTSN